MITDNDYLLTFKCHPTLINTHLANYNGMPVRPVSIDRAVYYVETATGVKFHAFVDELYIREVK